MEFPRQEHWSGVPLPSPFSLLILLSLSSSLPGSAFFKCQPSSQLCWEFSIAFPFAKGIRKLIFSHLITGHLVQYIFLIDIFLCSVKNTIPSRFQVPSQDTDGLKDSFQLCGLVVINVNEMCFQQDEHNNHRLNCMLQSVKHFHLSQLTLSSCVCVLFVICLVMSDSL